jgi:acetyl-CoA carboxylase carboxyl transferase subunit beta
MVDPCLGGTTASYAMMGDVNIAEPGAYIGFAGRRVIEQTMRQKLPQDAATAEFLLQHGMVDMVTQRAEISAVLARLLKIYMAANVARERDLVGQLA